MSELKRCPFCEAEIFFDWEVENFRCSGCGATAPYSPEGESVNSRPIEDRLQAEIDELKRENERLSMDKENLMRFGLDMIPPLRATANEVLFHDMEKNIKQLEQDKIALKAELDRLSELLHNVRFQLDIATDLGNNRWIALNEIYSQGQKRNLDWCIRKAREGLGMK